MADWSGLPTDLLDLIYQNLDLLADQVRFSAVCLWWKSVADNQSNNADIKTCSNPPLLLVPTKFNTKLKRSLYNVIDNKFYRFKLSMPLNTRCCGSSYGWLAFYNAPLDPFLFNPFTNKTIFLPGLETRPEPIIEGLISIDIIKVVLSANPDHDHEFMVACIFSDHSTLAFMKAGDKSWTYIMDKNAVSLDDAIFYRGQLLAVRIVGMILSVDVSSSQVKIIAPHLLKTYGLRHVYLVESITGDLLIVRRKICVNLRTVAFDVYKLELHNETGMVTDIIELNSLGEETLFLGDSSSSSVLASKFQGLKQNSIYYTDDYYAVHGYTPRDIGMFSLDDELIHKHYVLNRPHNHMPPPIWIIPTRRY